jgi:hypothetical protein
MDPDPHRNVDPDPGVKILQNKTATIFSKTKANQLTLYCCKENLFHLLMERSERYIVEGTVPSGLVL